MSYFELEKVEAAGHVRDMEQTLEEVRELERRRTELFRQAAMREVEELGDNGRPGLTPTEG